MNLEEYKGFMDYAIALAQEANNDVPIGAIVLDENNKIIGKGTNTRVELGDPIGHAEINAIVEASKKIKNWRLDNCTLVVTLEPCAMCAGAIAQSRISKVVFGAWDEKAGAAGSVWDILRDPRSIHKVEVIGGVEAEKSAALLSEFFNRGEVR